MSLDPNLIKRIRSNFESLSSDELQRIANGRDTSQWSEEAFEAARQLLNERSKGIALEPGVLSPEDNLWHDGNYIIARAYALFPNRCIICNRPSTTSFITLKSETDGDLVLHCQVCPTDLRLSRIAKPIHRICLLVGALTYISLLFSIFEGLEELKSKVGILVAAVCWGTIFVFVWTNYLAPHMRRGGSSLVQLQVIKLGCLVLPGLFLFLVALLIRGWQEGYYLQVFLATIPPIVGSILLKIYYLQLSISSSQPVFFSVTGAGKSFRASLPLWPGYPRTESVLSPGDIGKKVYS